MRKRSFSRWRGSGEQRVRAEPAGDDDEAGILLGGFDGGPGRHDLKARNAGKARADCFDQPHSPELTVRRAREIAKGKNREVAVGVRPRRAFFRPDDEVSGERDGDARDRRQGDLPPPRRPPGRCDVPAPAPDPESPALTGPRARAAHRPRPAGGGRRLSRGSGRRRSRTSGSACAPGAPASRVRG